MNKGSYTFPSSSVKKPVLVSFTTVANSQSIALPPGVRNGDTLILAIGQRNGTYTPPEGWGSLLQRDASGGEYNLIYMKAAMNEPRVIPTIFAGAQSAILFAFRQRRPMLASSVKYGGTVEQAPAHYGISQGVFIGFAFDAASGTHVTGFTGLTTIGRLANSDSSVCAAYRYTHDTSNYGPYAATPTGAIFDGYASIVIG